MPLYEYQCKACGHEYEVLQKPSDLPLVHCPACSLPELHKKLSAAGFRLKGGGWYETDFKSGNKRNVLGDGKSDTSSSSSSSSDSSSSDSAPAKAACGGSCACH